MAAQHQPQVIVRDASDQFHVLIQQPGVPNGYTMSPAYPSRTLAVTALAIWQRRGVWPVWNDSASTWEPLDGTTVEAAVADLASLLARRGARLMA